MSYSFSCKGATKEEVLGLVNGQFDQVEQNQPVHAADMPAARDAVAAFVNLLPDDADCDTGISVNGWISTVDDAVRQVSITITAGLNPPRGA
jgi:hypothetical protein